MKFINFSNVEELIFYDRQLQGLLPQHMFSIFEQWRLAQRIPLLRELGKQAILDFLNAVTPDNAETIEHYFGEKIVVEKLNYNIVRNISISLTEDDACEALCKIEGFSYYSLWRDQKNLYITFWR